MTTYIQPNQHRAHVQHEGPARQHSAPLHEGAPDHTRAALTAAATQLAKKDAEIERLTDVIGVQRAQWDWLNKSHTKNYDDARNAERERDEARERVRVLEAALKPYAEQETPLGSTRFNQRRALAALNTNLVADGLPLPGGGCEQDGGEAATASPSDFLLTPDLPARVRHRKRGGSYRVLGYGGIQTEVPLVDDARVVVYQNEKDGRLRVRRDVEFDETRFEFLDPSDHNRARGDRAEARVRDAANNLLIAMGMGWDLDGSIVALSDALMLPPEPATQEPSEVDERLIRAQAFLYHKYVARFDKRQEDLGLAYMEAERQDLARTLAGFVEREIAAMNRTPALDLDPIGCARSLFSQLDAALHALANSRPALAAHALVHEAASIFEGTSLPLDVPSTPEPAINSAGGLPTMPVRQAIFGELNAFLDENVAEEATRAVLAILPAAGYAIMVKGAP